jgi:hypothetical protein
MRAVRGDPVTNGKFRDPSPYRNDHTSVAVAERQRLIEAAENGFQGRPDAIRPHFLQYLADSLWL